MSEPVVDEVDKTVVSSDSKEQVIDSNNKDDNTATTTINTVDKDEDNKDKLNEKKRAREDTVEVVSDSKDNDNDKHNENEEKEETSKDKDDEKPSIKRLKEDSITETDDKEKEKEEKPTTEKPKFVFGSNQKFSFGSNNGGFSMFGGFSGKSVFDKLKEEKEKEAKEEEDTKDKEQSKVDDKKDESTEANGNENKPKILFGSKSKFANSFEKSVNAPSIFDKVLNQENEDGNKSEIQNEIQNENKVEESSINNNSEVYKAVHLEKQQVKSGEEDEECLFQVKAKLYNLDLTNVREGWKEKGVGILKVNKHNINKGEAEVDYKARLVMRQEGNFKLILNIPIVPDFKLHKGMVSSMHSDKFMRFEVIENGKPTQYALKIGMIENSEKLFNIIQSVIPI